MRGVGGRLRSLRIGCLWRERIAARSEGQISKRRVWALLVVVPAPSRDPWGGCHNRRFSDLGARLKLRFAPSGWIYTPF